MIVWIYLALPCCAHTCSALLWLAEPLAHTAQVHCKRICIGLLINMVAVRVAQPYDAVQMY